MTQFMKNRFSGSESANPSKKFLAYVLDFIIALVLSVLMFFFCELIANNTPSVKNNSEVITERLNDMYDIIVDTKLSKINEYGQMTSGDVLFDEYIHGSVLHSLKENGETDISSLYQKYEDVDEHKERLFYYYTQFKENHREDFSFASQEQKGVAYYHSLLLNGETRNYFEEGDFLQLNLESAKDLDEYFKNDNYSKGKKIFLSIQSYYQEAQAKAVKEVQNEYQPYVRLYQQYDEAISRAYSVKQVELFVSYAFSIFICYFLLPMILKNGRTIALLSLKLGCVDHNENEVRFYHLLLKTVVNLLEYFIMVPIAALLFFGPNALELLSTPIFLNISYLSLIVFSALLMGLSLLVFGINRRTHSSISELAGMMIVKGGEVFTQKEKTL